MLNRLLYYFNYCCVSFLLTSATIFRILLYTSAKYSSLPLILIYVFLSEVDTGCEYFKLPTYVSTPIPADTSASSSSLFIEQFNSMNASSSLSVHVPLYLNNSSLVSKSNLSVTVVPSNLTNVVSWRQEGIKYKKNDVFLDVIEKVNLLVARDGTVLDSEIVGTIEMKVCLSGMPELKLGRLYE